jgi:hypothetical protein
LDFIICIDLLFRGLSRSYNPSREFDKLTPGSFLGYFLIDFFFNSIIKHVARVRRHGENICPTLNLKCKPIWQNVNLFGKYRETRKSCRFIGRKWNESRHLVFWSLGTLIGLKDRVRGLVA